MSNFKLFLYGSLILAIILGFYVTPMVKQYKSNMDYQAYQAKNLLEGIDAPANEKR